MRKLLFSCMILLFLISPVVSESHSFVNESSSFINFVPADVEKQIELKGSLSEISPRSVFLKPIEATIGPSGLNVTFLSVVGIIDVKIYSESGSIVYLQSVNTQTQQYVSIDLFDWNNGRYKILFTNSTGRSMSGFFEIA